MFKDGSREALILSAVARLQLPELQNALALALASRDIQTQCVAATIVSNGETPLAQLFREPIRTLRTELQNVIASAESNGRIGDVRSLAECVFAEHISELDAIFKARNLDYRDLRLLIPAFVMAERDRGAECT